jgi:dTDP-4-amino-4,6-dideoxygalactose transaminase
VLESGQFVFGPNVAAFEQEAADFLGVPETIGVANGRTRSSSSSTPSASAAATR